MTKANVKVMGNPVNYTFTERVCPYIQHDWKDTAVSKKAVSPCNVSGIQIFTL